MVKSWKDQPSRIPISSRLPKLFKLNKSEFWGSVVFYNYLQSFAGTGARQRPKKEQWTAEESAEAFQDILDCFEPDRVLVLGKDLWTNLPSNPRILARAPQRESKLPVANNIGGRNKVDEVCYWYITRSGKPALAMPIMHPSAPGFRHAIWIEPVTDWMNFDGSPIFR
jgi:hypothetical protein